MTKSQNTKKDLCITSEQLTEQWKKGELPSGWYYLKVNEELANCPVIAECVDDYNLGLPLSYFYDFDVAKIEQVLAPVPSYDELQNMNKAVNECMSANIKLVEQNAQLKKLLKKANKFLKDYGFTFDGKDCAEAFKVHTKINEVLK